MVATSHRKTGEHVIGSRIEEELVEKSGDGYVLKSDSSIRCRRPQFQDEQEPRQRGQPRFDREAITVRILSACMKCIWARWSSRSRGTRATSSA